MLKQIPITELKAGMYVHAIARQNTDKHDAIKRAGLVPSDELVKLLRERGVLEVIIDTDKGKNSDYQPPEAAPAAKPASTKVPMAEEMVRAQALYSEARGLQQKALHDLVTGKPIEMKDFEKVTGSFIDSVFRNQDALACLTRIREKDAYLLEHSINVSILMAIFAKHLGIERKVMEEICLGALMHDLGKIRIPEEVLHKPGKLTDDEFELMKKHVTFSHDILLESAPTIPRRTVEVVIQHHEKLNGGGYPHGLSSDKISKYGRMISIVDIYDALTADRCYKRGMVPNAALGILQGLTPHQLDGDLVLEFIRCMSIYPVGTLVRLESGKLGIVIETNEKELTKPKVKVFYHTKYKRHIDVEYLDLAHPKCGDKIATCEKPSTHNIDIAKYF